MDTSGFVSCSSFNLLENAVLQELNTHGSTSVCYKVRLYGRLLFLKQLREEYAENTNFRLAFFKEFSTGFRLKHPNLANYIQFNERNSSFLMEFIEGDTLTDSLSNHPELWANPEKMLQFADQLFDVLHYLHTQQVLFLDLKPDNLMITSIGNQLKLVDLGCCRTDSFDSTIGKNIRFCAPEQIRGEELDARTDIYSAGKLLRHMEEATGKPLPRRLSIIARKCMQEDKEKRYQSAEEILLLLRKPKRSSLWYALWCVLLAFVGGGLCWVTSSHEKPLYDFEFNGIYYRILSEQNKTCEVSRKDKDFRYEKTVWIPSVASFNGKDYSVTSIGDSAFFWSNQMVLVNIPSSVTHIGRFAFEHCEGLSKLQIPESATDIEEGAFDFCLHLNEVLLPSKLKAIPNRLFSNSSNLQQIDLPEGIESIGIDAFGNCYCLKDIKLPSSLIRIGQGAFWHCYRLNSIDIPAGVTSIENYVFERCDSLSVIFNHAIVPQRITNIFSDSLMKPLKVIVPKGSGKMYSETSNWNRLEIEEGF